MYISQISLLQLRVLEQSHECNAYTLVQNVSWKYNPRFMDMYAQSVRVNVFPKYARHIVFYPLPF